jgi:hypothetical protein
MVVNVGPLVMSMVKQQYACDEVTSATRNVFLCTE